MAIAFRSAAVVSNDGGAKVASITQTIPAGTASGDLLLLAGGNSAPDTYTVPTGYAKLQDLQGNPPADVDGAAFWKTAGASESSFSFAAPSTNTTMVGALLAYTGASGVRTSAVVAATSAVTTSPAPPALTGVQASDLVVHIYIFGDDGAQAANVHDTVFTVPGGWTSRVNGSYASGVASQFVVNLLVCDKLAGADVPTVTASRAGGWTVISVALIASAGAAAPQNDFLPFFGAV